MHKTHGKHLHELKFFDEYRDLLERKKYLLEFMVQSEEGFGAFGFRTKKKTTAIAELDSSFFVKISNAAEASRELVRVRSTGSTLRNKDELLAELDKLCLKLE